MTLFDDPPEVTEDVPAAHIPDWKAEAREAFARWLETQPDRLPEHTPVAGHDADASGADLLRVMGALTALKQELKGLGRSSARLAAGAAQSTERLVATLQALADDLRASGREAAQQARIEAQRALLLELGDVREALREMVARDTPAPRKWRWPGSRQPGGARRTDALKVLARRIDGALERHGVVTVGAPHAAFDGACMTATGISREQTAAPGHVSAVVRVGFMAGSALLRPAEVIVESEESLS